MKTINITGLSKKSIPAHPTANLRSELVITEIRLGPPVTLAEKQHIYRLLAILLQSGLGIMDCIYLVVEQTGGKEARRVLARLGEDLAAGHSFSSCLSSQGTVFSAFEINSLRMGEQSGQLGEVFNSLANYFEKKVNLRRSVIQALSYPVTVIAISLVVMAFMLGFVVPMFRDIFQQFDAKLPAITEWVIGIAEFFTSGGWLVVPFAGILAGVGFLLRKRARFRRISSKIISRIPFLGEFVLKLSLARLAHSLGMLLSARVSLDQALDLSDKWQGIFRWRRP
ncbi:MAG: type II secretion system F family protein [Bacteroidia bacterium]